MNVIIAGSRGFDDYQLLKEKCDYFLSSVNEQITIICGMAKGADLLGKKYAEERGYGVLAKPADWDKYGKSAGFRRNEEMAKEADGLVLFWDGESPGSRHMLTLAKEYGLKIRIVYI